MSTCCKALSRGPLQAERRRTRARVAQGRSRGHWRPLAMQAVITRSGGARSSGIARIDRTTYGVGTSPLSGGLTVTLEDGGPVAPGQGGSGRSTRSIAGWRSGTNPRWASSTSPFVSRDKAPQPMCTGISAVRQEWTFTASLKADFRHRGRVRRISSVYRRARINA